MADLRNEYTQHIRNTAPDMDKLWNKISEEINKKENTKETETETTNTEREQIKRSGGYTKIVAAAAAFIVIFAGINIISESKKTKTAMNNIPTSRTEKAGASDKTDNAAAAEDKAGDNTNEALYDDAEQATEDTADISGQKNHGLTVKYDQLALNETHTISFMADYVPNGDEYFVEKNVLEQTDIFADVIVDDVEFEADSSAVYTLEVVAMYDKNGEIRGENITLRSSTPYILQQNREYLIPLKINSSGDYGIVFENAPQIEITLDGGAVFQNGWSSLDNGSMSLEKESLNVNDFYFDRMKYTPQFDMEQLMTEWKNA